MNIINNQPEELEATVSRCLKEMKKTPKWPVTENINTEELIGVLERVKEFISYTKFEFGEDITN